VQGGTNTKEKKVVECMSWWEELGAWIKKWLP